MPQDASTNPLEIITIGPYAIDPAVNVVMFNGATAPVGRRAAGVFELLARHAGTVVSKEALLNQVWPNSFVEEANLTQQVYLLRKIFREHGAPLALETVARRGYRLVVQPSGQATAESKSRSPLVTALALIVMALVFAGGIPLVLRAISAPAMLSARGAQTYRLGQYYEGRGSAGSLRKALTYFAETIASDPHNALGYAGYSETSTSLYVKEPQSAVAAMDAAQAVQMARQAVGAGPLNSKAHVALASAALYVQHDPQVAATELRRAIALDPKNSEALTQYAAFEMQDADFEAAARDLRRAIAYDPQRSGASTLLGWDMFMLRRYAGAAAFAREGLQGHPADPNDRLLLASVYLQTGRVADAIALLQNLLRSNPGSASLHALLSTAYDAAKNSQRARGELARIAYSVPVDPIDPFEAAAIGAAYARQRQPQNAQAWLSRVDASSRREVIADPMLDRLRSQPWFRRWSATL